MSNEQGARKLRFGAKNRLQSGFFPGKIMKTVAGTRATLGTQFKYGYKQGAYLIQNCDITKKHSVFVWMLSDMSVGSVRAKIAGELKNRHDEGSFICYFEKSRELYIWTYDDLRSIIIKR